MADHVQAPMIRRIHTDPNWPPKVRSSTLFLLRCAVLRKDGAEFVCGVGEAALEDGPAVAFELLQAILKEDMRPGSQSKLILASAFAVVANLFTRPAVSSILLVPSISDTVVTACLQGLDGGEFVYLVCSCVL